MKLKLATQTAILKSKILIPLKDMLIWYLHAEDDDRKLLQGFERLILGHDSGLSGACRHGGHMRHELIWEFLRDESACEEMCGREVMTERLTGLGEGDWK